jgi:hypothetical protein
VTYFDRKFESKIFVVKFLKNAQTNPHKSTQQGRGGCNAALHRLDVYLGIVVSNVVADEIDNRSYQIVQLLTK